MPPTIPLPLMSHPEDHPTPEARSEVEAEITIMKVQILVMAPRLWRQHNADLMQPAKMARSSRNLHEVSRNAEPLRPHTDFIVRDQEHKEETLLRDTQVKSADLDRAMIEGPKKYSRKDAMEALLKTCRKTLEEIQGASSRDDKRQSYERPKLIK
ncbi:hypothetical protein AC579_3465 [Pseudocercospora musae]|uniref:Uncharacterized protein n=1 Tax=Pseudocercospora musae TaxID=113226 RepID=A0A139IEN9_9PEZI|nr:hypothetical protein AC579_3465 [Pseudocercospora musae]